MDYDVIVIGAGSAGLTYAIGANTIGAKVLLIEKHKIGGDCTHYGCIPSKALIHLSKEMRTLHKYNCSKHILSLNDAQQNVKEIVNSVYAHETPEKIRHLGIDVEIGTASFVDKHTILVNSKKYRGKRIILATGTEPKKVKIPGINSNDILTNKDIFNFTKKSLAIIGAGPIGCELAQAFSQFNCTVYVINTSAHILSKEDKRASLCVEKVMREDGIHLYNNSIVCKGEKRGEKYTLHIKDTYTKEQTTIEVEGILQAIGRKSSLKKLNIGNVYFFCYDSKGIFTNASTQTTQFPHIYAIGDVARNFQFTHFANHMAKVSLAKSIFKLPLKIAQNTPRITFTQPEIASIGSMNCDLNKGDIEFTKSFNSIDKAICEQKKGFITIVCTKKGHIKGATIVGDNSSELIGEIAVIKEKKLTVSQVANIIHPYPSYGYGLRNLFDEFRAKQYTPKKKALIKRLFGLRGN